jgi:hypothetical protein
MIALTTGSAAAATSTYEIRLAGHLDDHWAAVLGDLDLTRRDDGTTALTGQVADQARLHGLLARVRDLGVTLVSLRMLDPPAAVAPALTHPLRTERLTLRPAVAADADVTWTYRRLETVAEWLTEAPTDLEAYRASFADPRRLAATIIVGHDGAVVGDFMLRVEDAWAQAEVTDLAMATQAELGWVLDPMEYVNG